MNIQEEFNFLLRNLSEKNEENEEHGVKIINKLRQALTNVINSFITDFDKMSKNATQNKVHLPPIFTMISLYIEQYTELFINDDSYEINKRNVEQEFTNFVLSRMLRILANSEIKSLHSHSIKLIILMLETFCVNSPYEFLNIVTEIIDSLHDLLEFDKEFFEYNQIEPKTLNRFTNDSNSFNLEQNIDECALMKKRSIIITTPTTCSFLQSNLMFILNEISIQYVNIIHDMLYEKLWLILCEQIELGDKCLKIMSYNLVLSILDLRVLPRNRFDFSNECLLYFIDCILATLQMTYTDYLNASDIQTENNDVLLSSLNEEASLSRELDQILSLVINKIFRNTTLFSKSLDVNRILIQLIDIIKIADLNNHTNFLNDSLFSMTYNLTRLKIKSNKYIDLCILNDIADSLVDNLGKLNQINTYLNLTIAQGLTYEIEMNSEKNSMIDGAEMNDVFKFNLKFDNIQTKLYKKLIKKAKELLTLNKQIPSNSKEFLYKSNGLNSVYEIFSYACVMCQHDPFMIEEYKNPLIEFSCLVFAQNNLVSQQCPQLSDNNDSIFIRLLLYWTCILNDLKNAEFIHLPYSHALNNIKSIFLSSVQWLRNLTQNIIAFLSLPWLALETSGLDLEFFKDKGYKQCSMTLIQNTKGPKLISLKKICIELLSLIPKNICHLWRCHIISKCVRDDTDPEIRICAIKNLPYLIYFLGVSSNALMFQLIPPALKAESSLDVLNEYGNLLNYVCCLISRKSIIIRKANFDRRINILNYDVNCEFHDTEIISVEMCNYFELLCTCCDKKRIDSKILPKIKKRKNLDLFQTLYNRPKYVDTQILMTFVNILSSVGENGQNNKNELSENKNEDPHVIEIRSKLLKNLERTFNHLEFGRYLHQETITQDIVDLSKMIQLSKTSASNNKSTNTNLSFIYKEALKLFSDDSLNPIVRFDFSRFTIPKLICFVNNGSIFNQQISASNLSSIRSNDKSINLPSALSNEEAFSNAVSTSIYNLSSQDDLQLEHNYNLENQLCEGFLRAKSSKNKLDLYLYMISLGRYALSLKKCDEYMFVCVKHLLEIFDSNENDKWSMFTSSLAQRQLFILSKRINMQELLGEFEEKVCEIISDTIYNSIKRHQINYIHLKQQQGSNNISTTSYLQNANYSLKDVLRVFNVIDSCQFIRNYQRYLVPYLAYKTTVTGADNHKIITKSLEFLARKMNSNIAKLIEDNFPYIFTYTTLLNPNEIANVFHYITNEICLDIDKLINCNKQRLFNELLSRCGNLKYKQKVWQAVCVLSTSNQEEAAALVTMQLEDKRIVKSIEPGLLAALIHFDMCLMRSHINLKEKCQVLESLNVLIAMLGHNIITQVRYKIMTTLKLAMQQCSKFSELNCKLWDTFLRNVDKSALGAILNQVSVNLLHLLDAQPYKISKIFEYLIIQNKAHLENYFNELYFIPEQTCLNQVNQTLKKYTDVKYLLETSTKNSSLDTRSTTRIKALVGLIKHYLKGALHENADLRVKALEKLYSLLKEKCSEIAYLIQRQENSQIISEIVLALLNGCRDSDARAKLLFGSCLGEIGAIDPANVLITSSLTSSSLNTSIPASTTIVSSNRKSTNNTPTSNNTINNTMSPSMMSSTELIMNPTLVSENSIEFSESFSHSLIIELSKAYLAARTTHEQDSASYAIQECLKVYGCSNVTTSSNVSSINSNNKIQNTKLWNSFPDYFKEILIPLRTSKYEIQSFDNLGSLKTPIILNECKNYEEWIYKWCAYLISKIDTHCNNSNIIDLTNSSNTSTITDKELKVFPKLQFIIRFNVNVALFILPYLIIKLIIQNISTEIIDQIFEEIMSVIQLNQLVGSSKSSSSLTPNTNPTILNSNSISNGNSKILEYQHICCQTVFNIYDHLMRQLNHYREKMAELQATINSSKRRGNRINNAENESLLAKHKVLFESFNQFIKRLPQQIISKAAYECKAYCRSLMHYELHMRNTEGAIMIRGNSINIDAGMLIELQNLYASMDEIDTASGILLLKKGSEESLADAAFRHKINGRLNESIACIEQMLESNESAKYDIKKHETYIRTFINVGRHRNALSYLDGLMNDRAEWKDALDSYRIETCWKLGSWDKLKQVININKPSLKNSNTNSDLSDLGLSGSTGSLNMLQGSNDLYNIVDSNTINSFNAGIGKLFVLVDECNEKEFNETLCMLREQQIGPLSAVSMEAGGNSYQRGYEYVVNLHALQEIESCMSQLMSLRNDTMDKEHYRNSLIKNLDSYLIIPWEHRVQTMQPSFKHLEPIYNVRIAMLNFLSTHLDINVSKPVAKLWLHLSKIARKAGMFENAYQYMLNAQGQIKPSDSSYLEELLVEKSKWYWQRNDQDSALFYLQKGLNELFNNDTSSAKEATNKSELYSKVLLMYTKYSEENGSLDSDTIRKNYLKVQRINSKSEQAHFQLAQFTDRLGTSVSENTGKKEKFYEYIAECIAYYSNSLEYGCQYIYQSLPRMIALWLDFGADYFDHQNSSSASKERSSTHARNLSQLNTILIKLNQIISNALQRIPTYAFLTVYPQMVSRICHPEERVFETLSNILMKVLFLYPSQAIWMLIAVKNSSVELRKNRCKKIMDKAVRQQPDLKKFINDSSELAEKLVQLGNLNVESGVSALSLTQCFKPLKRLVESKDFSRVIIPSQFQVTLQLPSNESGNNTFSGSGSSMLGVQSQNFRTHNPYPLELVYIMCFEDNVLVMNSLQKPKKVTIRGTDGKLYPFLSKAKDDLRIDYRIMEFFSVVNKCLKQEPEARRRNLYIRTYAVTPLNETSGIIEWIDGLSTLRSILLKLYAERGIGSVTSSEWRQHEEKCRTDKEYQLKTFRNFLAKYRPTVLYEWFLRTFQEPNSWYNARSNYVRTAAVMSVCGYVLGLGDRHCENILMASSNGDCIHVDFNCLFNKGETLGVPEIVPFRLTHNMTEAMGPLGYEGIYRKTCECSLKILRDYKEPLITILKTFIYDPLVEWKTPANRTHEIGETISAKGQIHLQNITCRLKGMHTTRWISTNSKVKALPLSVEGHVNTLIKEATEDKNLCAMYIGWSAFF